ncbi:MAG: zinc dependent phospholipase C family protein [Alphaproteobacteria bacterium]|nr:zinc dependent phospholipase C family protein [Alphaproteobacteria bacterium]
MPKELTHCLFADETLARHGGSLEAMLAPLRSLYHLGAVAVDSYFYASVWPGSDPSLPEWGDLIHGAEGNNTANLPLRLLLEARGEPDPTRRAERTAFAAGILTHMAMDATLHPYVYHVTGDYYAPDAKLRQDAQIRHRSLESWLDWRLLERAGLSPRASRIWPAIDRAGDAVDRCLTDYARAVDVTFGRGPPSLTALRRGYRVQRLTHALIPHRLVARAMVALDRLLKGRLTDYVALFYPWAGGTPPRAMFDFESFIHPVTGERLSGGMDLLIERARLLGESYLAAVENFVLGNGDEMAFRSVVRGVSLDFGLIGVRAGAGRHFATLGIEELWPGKTA